jgi:hypothetical protein
MHKGTPFKTMELESPFAALFFNHNPNKLIVACKHDIFIVDVSTQSMQSFSSTPQGACYNAHALTLSDDDAVLVAGSSNSPFSVCGYDTASLTRLWIHTTASHVGAICMLGTHVLLTVYGNPTLVLDSNSGAHIAAMQKADGYILGLGVIGGLCFILTRYHPLRPPHFRVSRHAAASPLQET